MRPSTVKALKTLLAAQVRVEDVVKDYTEGAMAGKILAILFLEGQYTCEHTGTIYQRQDVEDCEEEFLMKLANAAAFHMVARFVTKLNAIFECDSKGDHGKDEGVTI